MTRLPIKPRSRRAAREAERLDRAWFAANPDRDHHSRPALQFEYPDFGPTDHEQHVTLVQQVRRSDSLKRIGSFPIRGSARYLPDHERFLSLLWAHIDTINADPSGRAKAIFVTQQAHADLLKVAGIDPRSI